MKVEIVLTVVSNPIHLAADDPDITETVSIIVTNQPAELK
jgi:hypothetical protein